MEGVDGYVVRVECSLRNGLHKFGIVGLPDRGISEAKDRIQSALISSGIEFPYGNITINLSPAYRHKTGSHFDLPIAASIILCLDSQKKVKLGLDKTVFLGELGLDGEVKYSKGLHTMIIEAKRLGFKNIVIPDIPGRIPALYKGLTIFTLSRLNSLLDIVYTGKQRHSKHSSLQHNSESGNKLGPSESRKMSRDSTDLSMKVKILFSRAYELRVLAIAAVGGHNLLLDGPPGSGKSTLLESFPCLLPDLSESELLEVYKIHSLNGESDVFETMRPPLRTPHHSSSNVSIMGGGTDPTPGEVSLAHRGVLFLDEVAEFKRELLESLRQPLVDGVVQISRANYKVKFPALFQLLATRNPCPCGWDGEREGRCTCSLLQKFKYQNKLSGPLLDRIDIKHRLPQKLKPDLKLIQSRDLISEYQVLREQISNSRAIQLERFRKLSSEGTVLNSQYKDSLDWTPLLLSKDAKKYTQLLFTDQSITMRKAFKVLKLARSIADYENSTLLKQTHLDEALNLNYYDAHS